MHTFSSDRDGGQASGRRWRAWPLEHAGASTAGGAAKHGGGGTVARGTVGSGADDNKDNRWQRRVAAACSRERRRHCRGAAAADERDVTTHPPALTAPSNRLSAASASAIERSSTNACGPRCGVGRINHHHHHRPALVGGSVSPYSAVGQRERSHAYTNARRGDSTRAQTSFAHGGGRPPSSRWGTTSPPRYAMWDAR